ncbi:MAG: LysE family translocator [Actinomycetota bacterium]
MPEWSTLVAFIVATAGLLVIPGPAVVYMVNRTLADGTRAWLTAVAGLEIGDTIQSVLAALGVSAAIATSSALFNTVKWAGVAYLVWTGARTMATVPPEVTVDGSHSTRGRIFRQGVWVNTLNPKTALFFLAVFPQFVDPAAEHATIQSLVLAVVFVVMATVFNSGWVLGAAALRPILVRGRAVPIMRRWVSGGLFVALGVFAAVFTSG